MQLEITDTPKNEFVRSAPWNGVQVRRRQFQPAGVNDQVSPQLRVDLHLSRPYHLEWKRGTRFCRTPMPSGALCIIPVSEPISYRWEEPVDVIMVDLAPSLLNSAAAGLNLRTDFEIPERHGDIDPQVSYICQALWAESQAGYPLGRLFGDSLAIALTACLLQRYSTTPSASPPPGKLPPRAWKNVVSYVEEHLQDDISLEDMARIARLSPFHFSRCFKAMSGTSPHQYVIERRVERARELLTKSNLSLSQIAIESGFSDQSHLTRHMKRLLGLTPGLLTSGRSSSKNVQ